MTLARRQVLALAVASGAVVAAEAGAAAADAGIVAEEHWATKGDVRLYLYRKRQRGRAGTPLFLVHGSSFSGRGGYDLQVPDRPGYSMMDRYAARGFDVWTLDHEGYGRSTHTGSNSDIASGADDLAAAFDVVERVTGRSSFAVYGQSAGALRAGLLAMRAPERFERMVLDGFSWTGKDAPEIMRRRQQIETYRAPWRQADPRTYVGIFSRDDPSTFDPAVPAALARYELALGDRIPNGTYADMATKLPLVDPAKLTMPVQILRAETDGNASQGELLDFFSRIAAIDKQYVQTAGVAHIAVLGRSRERVFHAMDSFLTMPAPASPPA